ncbi:MAG: dTMP kinase [Nitrososphaeria archaeon]
MKIITIEGIDQSGKKTQSNLVVSRLKKMGVNAIRISFPDYETPVGQLIKRILSEEVQVPIEVKHILLSANRWELKPKIEQLIKQHYIIVFDRYYQSNLAYGMANNLPLSWLENLDSALPRSDLTILIDILPEVSFRRKENNRDAHEKDIDYLSRVRACFIALAKRYDWVIIDGDQSVEKVHESIWQIVSERLKHNL